MTTSHGGLEALMERVNADPRAVQREKTALEQERTAFRLRQLRKAMGLTQSELAELLGVSQNRVSRLERGEARSAQLSTLQRYIAALGGELYVAMRLDDVDYPIAVSAPDSAAPDVPACESDMASVGS